MSIVIEHLNGFLSGFAGGLIDASLKGFVILGLAGGVVLLMRSASAAARHLAWLLAICCLLALPFLSNVLPHWAIIPGFTERTINSAMNVHLRSGSTFPHSTTGVREIVAPTDKEVITAKQSLRTDFTSGVRDLLGSRIWRAVPQQSWLALIWIWGATFLGFRLCASFLWLWLSMRQARRIDEGPLLARLRSVCSQLGVRRPVCLFLDARRNTPSVWGIFVPNIILPEAASRWAASRLQAVLLHEVAHVKRQDLLSLLLVQIASAFYWFNPLIWVALKRLRTESERACDDLVPTAGVNAADYAEHLVHVASQLGESRSIGALAMARPSQLEGRVLAVLNDRLNRRAITYSFKLGVLAVALCVIIPVSMLRVGAATTKAAVPGINQEGAVEISPVQRKIVTIDISTNGTFAIGGKPASLVDLSAEMVKRVRQDPELVVYVRPSSAPYKLVAELLNALQEAQVVSVSLRTEPATSLAAEARDIRAPAETRSESGVQSRRLTSLAESEAVQAKLDIEQRQAQLEAEVAKVDLGIARGNLKRLSELQQNKLASPEMLQGAEAELAKAEARLQMAEFKTKRLGTHFQKADRSQVGEEKKQLLKHLLAQEMEIAEAEVKELRKGLDRGVTDVDSCLHAELDLLSLKREMAQIEGNRSQELELVREQLCAFESLEKSAHRAVEVGTKNPIDELKVKRQILALKRQEALLE